MGLKSHAASRRIGSYDRDMGLTKKTTILFPPEQHRRLARLAAERGTSLGELVRSACDREYGSASREEKLAAVRKLASLHLPVASPLAMKRESVPRAPGKGGSLGEELRETSRRYAALPDRVEPGGKPVARLVRAEPARKPQFGGMKGEISWTEGWERALTPDGLTRFFEGRW
jgi:hypothetical protein